MTNRWIADNATSGMSIFLDVRSSQKLLLCFATIILILQPTSARRGWIAESPQPSSGPSVARRHDLPSAGFPYENVQLPRRQGRPVDVTTDAINDLGVKILDLYVQRQRGNVAFSPSGLGFVLVALYEGAAGSSAREISDVLGLPRDRRVTRIGLRDIHRRLRSYLNADAFLGGLTLNRDDINLREDYERILRFYGFDISDSAMENNESTSSTGNVTESSNESNGDEVETLPSTKLNEAGRGLTTVASTVSGTSASSSPVSNVPTNAPFSPAIVASTAQPTTTSIDPNVIDGPTSSVPITNDNVATTTSTSPSTLAVDGNVATTTSTSTLTTNDAVVTAATSNSTTNDAVATAPSNSATNNAVATTAPSTLATNDAVATTAPSTLATNDAVATATSNSATNDAVATTAPSTLATNDAVATATSTLATNDAVATATSNSATDNAVATATSTLATNDAVATATSTLATNDAVATMAPSTLATNGAVATPSTSTPAAAILPENTVTETSMRRRRGLFHGPLGYFSASPPDTADVWLDEVYGRLNDNEDYPSEKEGGEGGEDSRRPTEIVFLVNGCDYSRVTGATYTAFLPFSHFASLRASLLEFPLDDPRYKILVMLPSEATNGTRDLARTLATRPITLRKLRGSLGATWLTAVVPSFMLRGFVTLTPYLQRLGISDVFDPRAADLTPMSPDLGVYARDVQQSIGLDIRNNAKDGGRGIGGADGGNEEPRPRARRRRQRGVHSLRGALLAPPLPFFLTGGPVSPRFQTNLRYPSYSGPLYERAAPVVPFVVDRPFLYFIVDDETSVTLLAGRIDDPLNSRLL